MSEAGNFLAASTKSVKSLALRFPELKLKFSIVLVHGLGGPPDSSWAAFETYIARSMQHQSCIRTWEYDEEVILRGSLDAQAILSMEAEMLSQAIEQEDLKVTSLQTVGKGWMAEVSVTRSFDDLCSPQLRRFGCQTSRWLKVEQFCSS